jgi:putative hemolysin
LDTIFLEVVIVAILILVNGFFSCSEFAIISIRKSRVAQLVAEGDERAKIIETLQADPHRVLALVQIGVTVVGSAASAIGGLIAGEQLKPVLQNSSWQFVREASEPIAIFIVVAVISYLSLIIGELVPKSLGLFYADSIALGIARPINVMAKAGGMLVTVLTASSKAVLAVMGIKGEGRAFMTREEVQHIVAEGHETGAVTAVEREYIRNVFDFTHTYVREVMVPRTRMVALDLETPREEMLQLLLDNMYSRYPVYRESLENIIGFVHSKDLLGGMVSDTEFDINSIIRPPYYVPEGKRLNDMLKEMQRKRIHMALVVDEYGGISGLVTTEDLIEELVGEIEDEHDIGEPRRVQRLPDGSLSIDALISISDLEDILGIDLGEDVPYDTLAGLILDQLGRFPEKGEKLEWKDYVLTCDEVKKTAIVKVRITRKEPSETSG